MKPEDLAKNVAAVVNKSLRDFGADIEKKINALQKDTENRFASLPAPEKGEKGDPGNAVVGPKGNDGAQGPQGEPGEKGEKGDPGADAVIDEKMIWDMIAEQFKTVEIPTPEKGEKGDPGEPGNVDMEVIKSLISEEVSRVDFAGGKSLLEEEIEDEIKDKSYARGTIARHKGGIWRARERTKGMQGWECLVAGIADIKIDFDGERTVTITTEKSDDVALVHTVKIDAPRFRDIYKQGEKYEKHDWVQLAGSIWMALKDTEARPGSSDDWKLMVKRGGTGKSAYDLSREAGFTGSRQEWLDNIGKKPIVKVGA